MGGRLELIHLGSCDGVGVSDSAGIILDDSSVCIFWIVESEMVMPSISGQAGFCSCNMPIVASVLFENSLDSDHCLSPNY